MSFDCPIILQQALPFAPWVDPRTRRLPGTIPVGPDDWIQADDAFAAQMALRDRLIAVRPEAVLALAERARPAAEELWEMVMALLPARGYAVGAGAVTRPDGVSVPLDRARPLATLGRLVQEDLCLMQPGEDGAESVLTGAVLCFPAGWSLSEKFDRPMMRIHRPVEKYDEDVGRRVQRLMDGVQPGRPLCRGTAHRTNSRLHNPRTEAMGRSIEAALPFIRVERQCLVRLPVTRAVLFSIHTYIVEPGALSAEQVAALHDSPLRHAA
ncbi:heme-dependent oxidative N-demethylase family protein [Frigidibacter sp. MR17.24]|uniref:heme-dependent oxidative N-demethylase family protein n=1 Tax=Frigidibacter sp. MR17.24 TaxID=3127345 RepID=UPI003012FE1B